MNCVLIFLSLAVITQAQPEWLTKLNDKINQEIVELVDPVLTASEELEQLVNEYETKKMEEKQNDIKNAIFLKSQHESCIMKHLPTYQLFSYDACVNFTDTLTDAGELVYNATLFGYTVSTEIGSHLFDLLKCADINPISAVKCLINNLAAIKKEVLSVKPNVLKYTGEIKNVIILLRAELSDCWLIETMDNTFYQNKIEQVVKCTENVKNSVRETM